MTYNELMGKVNPTHSLTHSLAHSLASIIIFLLKYRRGELHLGSRRGPDFGMGDHGPQSPPLELLVMHRRQQNFSGPTSIPLDLDRRNSVIDVLTCVENGHVSTAGHYHYYCPKGVGLQHPKFLGTSYKHPLGVTQHNQILYGDQTR